MKSRVLLLWSLGLGALMTSSMAIAQPIAQPVPESIPKRPESLLRQPVPPFEVPYGEVRERTLANGLTLVALEDETVPLVDVAVAVRVGSQLEDQWDSTSDRPAPGTMSMLATLLRRGGTSTLSVAALDEASESRGVEIQSFGGRYRSGVIGSAASADFDMLSQWLADVLVRPGLDSSLLARYREATKRSFPLRYDSLHAVADREWNALVLGPEHPRFRALRPSDVDRWTQSALRSAHQFYYRPQSTVIAIAGGVAADQALDRFEQLFGSWQPADVDEPRRQSVEHPAADAAGARDGQQTIVTPRAPGFYQLVRDIPQGVLMLGHMGSERRSWSDSSADAAELVAEILAGPGPVSRLRGRLRDRDGLVYSVSGSVGVGSSEPGLVQIAWQVDPANGLAALSAALEEIDRLREQPPPQKELDLARGGLVDALPTLFDTAEKIAGRYAEDLLLGRPHDFWQRYAGRLARVTAQEVQRAAASMIRPSEFRAVWVGPRLPKKELRRLGFQRVEELLERDPVTLAPLP